MVRLELTPSGWKPDIQPVELHPQIMGNEQEEQDSNLHLTGLEAVAFPIKLSSQNRAAGRSRRSDHQPFVS